jgi:3-hydroxymyristoyl/3-hydroxydecanoyl-(acyl carrier protein) dehydratase
MTLYKNLEYQKVGENQYEGKADIDPNNIILQSHFPGNPIVPGVAITFLVKQCVSAVLGFDVRLISLSNGKFIKPIIPGANNQVTVLFSVVASDTGWIVNADVSYEGNISAQFKSLQYSK